MNHTPSNTYKNTARAHVIDFIASLAPTQEEGPYLASVFEKHSLSMRDFKILCDFIAHRAAEDRLNPESVAALGLSSLPAPAQRAA